MSVLKLEYLLWKSISLGGNLKIVFKPTQRENRIHAWSGNQQNIFRTIVDSEYYSDWVDNFESNAEEVGHEDEAVAKIIEYSSGGAVTAVERTCALPRWEKWDSQSLNTSWTTMFEKSAVNDSKPTLYEVAFHVNSKNIHIRLEIDGEEHMNLYLDELYDSFKLRKASGCDEGGSGHPDFSIVAYEGYHRWRVKVPNYNGLHAQNNFKIQMRANKGTERCYRGLVVWGLR
jgi:hypothetical protein